MLKASARGSGRELDQTLQPGLHPMPLSELLTYLYLLNKEDGENNFTLIRDFLMCYKKYITPSNLLTELNSKILSKSNESTGAQRFLETWLEIRYDLDYKKKPLLKELFIVLNYLKTKNLYAANRLNLALIRGSRRNTISLKKLKIHRKIIDEDRYTPEEIAMQLTLLEWDMFLKIKPEEFFQRTVDKTTVTTNLTNLIARSNLVSMWIASHILIQKTIPGLTRAVARFIVVCKFLIHLNNYNGMMEVYGGLQLWSVSRLSKIYKLPKKFTTMINEIEEFASPKDNSAYLRKHISYNLKLGIPTIPYVGLMLKDLTFIEDGNLDFVKDNLVNIDKISMIGIKLKELDGFQKKCHITNKLLTKLPSY